MAINDKGQDELWLVYLLRKIEEAGVPMSYILDQGRGDLELPFVSRTDEDKMIAVSGRLDFLEAESVRSLTRKSPVLDHLVTEVFVGLDEDSSIGFEIYEFENNNSRVTDISISNKSPNEKLFRAYEEGRSYRASGLVESVLQFVPQLNVIEDAKIDDGELECNDRLVRSPETYSGVEGKIDEILKAVRGLQMIAGGHPMVLKDEGTYLQHLYVRAINEDVNNLQFLDYQGQRIPYVLVHSCDLEGQPGKPFKNLYFVARDIAIDTWQQQIVAYHESLCVKIGHDNAKAKEPALAEALGKLPEYQEWREQIDKLKYVK